MHTAHERGSTSAFAKSVLPLLSRNQHPLVEPDPKSAFVFQTGAELLHDVGIDVSVAQKNVKRLGLIVRQLARVPAVRGK